jgi:hypothetical protein
MAIILRHKSTIQGLTADLAALVAADAAEAAARATAVTAEETARIAAVLTEETARIAAVLAEENARIAAVSAEETARIAGDTASANALTSHINGAFTTYKNLLDLVNGDSLTDGSFRKAIADVVAAAPEALNTLKEIADYINVNPDATVADAIINSVTNAVNALKGDVTSAMDTLGEIEAAVTAEVTNRTAAVSAEETARLAADAAETAARAAAISSLDTALRAYTDSVASSNGATAKLESVMVAGNKIVLAFPPKGGINGVLNFGTVRHVDGGVAYDAPVLADGTDATGKTFVVSVDTSGEWDGKIVQVQYVHIV